MININYAQIRNERTYALPPYPKHWSPGHPNLLGAALHAAGWLVQPHRTAVLEVSQLAGLAGAWRHAA